MLSVGSRVLARWSSFLLFSASLAGALLSGCSSEPPSPSLRIERFDVSPANLSEPGEVSLEWRTSGASRVELHQDDQPLDIEPTATSGSITVSLTQDASFTLIAADASGRSVRVTRDVTVDLPPLPRIGSFLAPEVVEADEEGAAAVQVSWAEVEGADELRLLVPGRDPIELEPEEAEGSFEIRLSEDATLTLLATNEAGEASATAEVRVAYLPEIVRFASDRSRVGLGEATQISWETTGAIHLELWQDELLLRELSAAEGSEEVVLSISSTLELRAFNELETMASATLEVSVGAPEVLTLELSPASLWIGETATISWQTEGGSALEIALDATGETICDEDDVLSIAEGSCEWSPAEVGVHSLTLTLSNLSGEVSEELSLFAGTGPLITLFEAVPDILTAGDSFELRWAVHPDPAGNEAQLSLSDDRGGRYEVSGSDGSILTSLEVPGVYELTLEATTDHPDASASIRSIPLTVHPRPEVEFVATPSHFDDSVDDEVVISWTTADAETVVLYRIVDGEEEEVLVAAGAEREAGSYGFVPREARRYRLVATNSIGGSTIRDLEVTVAPLEVLEVRAEPAAFTQGQSIRLSWVSRMADEVSIDIGTKEYLLEETAAPYLDLEELGGSRLPLTGSCGGSIDTHGCAALAFPQDFRFPFDGSSIDAVWIYTPGYLSFTASGPVDSLQTNRNFPTDVAEAHVALAPFWDSLAWDPQRYPTGNVFHHLLEEDGQKALVIQWKDIGYDGVEMRSASFNFEVVLWESGAFEYRYGVQSARDSRVPQQVVAGSSATIGFQQPSQRDFAVIAFDNTVPMNGSREHRTFSFRPRPAIPRVGELVLSPYGTQATFPITVTASRDGATHSKSVMVQVSRKPIIELTTETIPPAGMGEEFLLGWKTSNAIDLVIVDEDEVVRFEAQTQAEVEEGVIPLQEEQEGLYRYTLRATGAHGFVSERQISVQIYGPFGIASFTADEDAVELGSGATLRWEVFGAESVVIYADGEEIFRDASGEPTGSFLTQGLEEETEFLLVATNDVGATQEATASVGIWDFVLGLQTTSTRVRAGEAVVVELDARVLDGGAPLTVFGVLPLVEVFGAADRFEDVSTHPDAVDLGVPTTRTATTVDVQLPFPFPYFGESHQDLRIFVDGYASLFPTANLLANNQVLPTTVTNGSSVHFAPFWDDLWPRNPAKMYTAQTGPDTFVVQWTNMSLAAGTTPAIAHNMNFQLVLHRSGAFEYRYGVMENHPTHRSTSCHPDTCINEVNGAAATIGYQYGTGAGGYTYHFGGTTPGAGNLPVAGGLSNRTFRYPLLTGEGSFIFYPDKNETFSFCATHGGETRCRELEVEVEFGLHEVSISKEIIEIGETVTFSWEGVGGQALNIVANGDVVFTTSDPAEVDKGTTELRPTQDTVYLVELVGGNRKESVRKIVEVKQFAVTATATASAGPLSPATLSWNLAVGDPQLTVHLITPMEEISNSDFGDYDISSDEDVIVVINPGVSNGVTRLDFEDFSFPYFGTSHGFVNVSSNGFLSFEAVQPSPTNVAIPSPDEHPEKSIAPFWEDLHTRPVGRVIAKKIDPDRYVIQWEQVSLRLGTSPTVYGDLNFLVVLHRNGNFEFRYGRMVAPSVPASDPTHCYPVSCELESRGASATIGYQLPGGIAGYQLHFGGSNPNPNHVPMPGGLEFRAWRFTSRTSAGPGSVQVHPADTTLYRICAYEPVGEQVRCAPSVKVEVPWGIDLFQVNPAAPLPGQPVTLNWSVQGLNQLRVLADGVEIASYIEPNIPLLGALEVTPSGTTTYTLEANSLGRIQSEERVVAARTFDLTVTGPSGRLFPGETVDIGWTLTQHAPGDVWMLTPMSEIPIGADQKDAFIDVSTLEGATELVLPGNNGSVAVELPFTFPYLGTQVATVMVFEDGYLGLSGTGGSSNNNNAAFPLTENVHMAIFWDSMTKRGNESLWSHSPDPSTMIIQWKGFSLTEGSSATDQYDLNFQVVLRADGSFDFRYGKMAPPPQPFSHSSCRPDSCANEANGSSATIGYQTIDGLYGHTLHTGSLNRSSIFSQVTDDSDAFLTFPGGLSNRTFRYTPATSGTAKLMVGRSGDRQVCGFSGDFVECKSTRIEAVASSGELMITEVMIDPASGVSGQWLELRNLSGRTIDLEGFELRSAQGSHRISRSLPVASGAFLTLAASENLHFTPDYVYGGDLPLNRLIDRLELWAGTSNIFTVAWGIDWTVPANEALSLDPIHHLTGMQESRDFAAWCNSGLLGSPGALGPGCVDPWYEVDPRSPMPFVDISGTGTRFYDVEGDDLIGRLPFEGFPLKLFGESHARIWVGSNGWVSLYDLVPTTQTQIGPPPSLPRGGTIAEQLRGPLIAVFWEQLRCADRCRVFYEQRTLDGEEVLIIQWDDFHAGQAVLGSLSFQLQIWEEGDLVVAFDTVENPYMVGTRNWGFYEGASSMIALEGAEPSTYLVVHSRRALGLDRRSVHIRAR